MLFILKVLLSNLKFSLSKNSSDCFELVTKWVGRSLFVGDFKVFFDLLALGEKNVLLGSTLRNISPAIGPF